MRRRFFVDQVRNGRAEISGEDARHLTRVLRVEAGEKYEISDNLNVYLAEVESARKEQVRFRTMEKLAPPERVVHIAIFAALIKFDAFERMIEKATELGVGAIFPFRAARSEMGLERAAARRLERWRKIALEASQQSRRARLPEIGEPIAWEEALAGGAAYRFALDEEPGGVPLLEAAPAKRSPIDTVAFLVGPEGGWTTDERAAIVNAGWARVTMGPLILRAETAAIAALAVAQNAWLVH